ncbi:MAG: hypothetical protein IJU16_07595 [Clostridia bacterium]|nr:hypothetical protein [Clostridia bacterium]
MEISIKLILQAIVKRIWIVILCALVAGGSAYAYTKHFTVPVYSMTMKVSALTNLTDDEVVSSVGSFINMMTLAQRRVQSYLELMNVTDYYKMVAEASGTGYSAKAIGSMISYEQIEGMGIFYVTVTGLDPNAIKAVGDALEQTMYTYINGLQSHSTIVFLEHATTPTTPITGMDTSNAIRGALLGALAAALVIALIAFFDTRIKDEETLMKRYDIPLLGTIPDFTVSTSKRSHKKSGKG